MKHDPIKSEDAAVSITITNVAVCVTVILVALIGSCSFNKRTDLDQKIVDACVQQLATKGVVVPICEKQLNGQR